MAVVLVIDDHQVLCQGLRRLLDAQGLTTLVAYSGQQAMQRIREQDVDLALVDLRLPDIDGVELFRQLRRQAPTLLGVLITAFPSIDTVIKAIHVGLVDSLPKPFGPDELSAAVHAALTRRPPVSHSPPHRLSVAIVRALDREHAVTRFEEWETAAHSAASTIQGWCRAMHISPRAALRFVRSLWAVFMAPRLRAAPADLLGFSEIRTTTRFLKHTGPLGDANHPIDLDTFLDQQQLIRHPEILADVRRLLSRLADDGWP